MIRKKSLRRASTEMEGIIPPSQDYNSIQGEASTMDMESGSLKLLCLRRRSLTRRGRYWYLIMRLILVQTMKSPIDRKSKMGVGSIPILPIKENISVPRNRDTGRLDPSIVGGRWVILLNWLQFVPLM